jgi:hypothetical protein
MNTTARTAVKELLHFITSLSETERYEGAGGVTDIQNNCDPFEVELLSRALVLVRQLETNEDCQEMQMDALADIDAIHGLSGDVMSELANINRNSLKGSQKEYFDDIMKNHPNESGI